MLLFKTLFTVLITGIVALSITGASNHHLQAAFDLKKYSGNFISETSEMKLKIEHRDTVLFAQAMGNPEFQIFPKGQHAFYGKAIEISFKFHVKNDTVRGVTAERKGQKFKFRKLK